MKTFDLALDEAIFKIKDGKDINYYVIQELDGDERDEYMNAMKPRLETDEFGNSQPANYKGLAALLLTRCIQRVRVEGEDEDARVVEYLGYVTKEEVNSWGSKMQMALMSEAQKMSGLTDEAIRKAKN